MLCWLQSQADIVFKVPMLQQLIFLIQNVLTLTPVQSLRQRLMLVCVNCMSQLLEEDLAQSPDAQVGCNMVAHAHGDLAIDNILVVLRHRVNAPAIQYACAAVLHRSSFA